MGDIYDYIFNIKIFGNTFELKLCNKYKLGEGSYGVVYFANINNVKCVIKILRGKCNLESEVYFYNKYYSSTHNNTASIPIYYQSGNIQNNIDNMIYDYIILEYVGFFTLKALMKNINRRNKENFDLLNKMIQIIYNTGTILLEDIHDNGLVCRDIKPENIIISDCVLSYFIYNLNLNITIPYYVCLDKNIKLEDIINNYNNSKYENILRFVDLGMFGDLDALDENFKFNDIRFAIDYIKFEPFDTLFITTMTYLSPFSIFNFKKFIDKRNFKEKKFNLIMLKKLLKKSDNWTYNLLFTIIIYSLYGNYDMYVNCNSPSMLKYYNYDEYSGTNKYLKFCIFDIIDDKIIIKKEILNVLLDNNVFISCSVLSNINTIMNTVQCFLNCKTNNKFPFEINLDFKNKENIVKLL
jgi:serine/threonine protein kinase